MSPWRKFFIFLAAIIAPALIVGISNWRVFPDSILAASILLGLTVLIAAVFTWNARQATRRVDQYCQLAELAISAALCVNLGGHWLLAREVSAARQGVVDRHAEEDREEKRRAADTERQLLIKQADAALAKENTRLQNAEARRLGRLPRDQRTSAIPAATLAQDKPQAPGEGQSKPRPVVPAATEPQAETKAPRLTPDEVIEKWRMFLTVMAFVEAFLAVGLGGILRAVWEWDRNHDGIPDHMQMPARSAPLARAPESLPDPKWPRSVDAGNGAGLGKGRPAWWKLWLK